MTYTRWMLTVGAVLVLGLASYSTAQMMGGGHDHSKMGKADSTSQSGMMGEGMMSEAGTMMGDMSQHCKTMSVDFDELRSHFHQMMQMNDMGALKAEMKEHQKMMSAMHQSMGKQQNMCQKMMSMMSSGGAHGQMGSVESDSATSETDAHKH